MARPAPLSGFPEFLPEGRIVEQHVLDTLRATFELSGFAAVETRAAEPLAELLRKGEIDKEVYLLRRLQADPQDDPQDDQDAGRRLGLHYDLTVPFARYVLENAPRLTFPFRRYQIQKVWRGERPQEGRYREFLQADVDVVGSGELAFHHDVEVAQVMAEALAATPLPPLRLQVNNRKLIEGFCRGLGAPDVPAVMRAIDKLDKLPPAAVHESLTRQAKLADDQAELCLRLAAISSPDGSFADAVVALGVSDPLLDEGLEELVRVVEGVADLSGERLTVSADLRIARGLDYYTGTVYETRMSGYEHLGSVCSGGRYDSLASDGTTTYPGVGISFGVTRALAPLIARGAITATRKVPSAVLVAVSSEQARADSLAVARALRARGVPAEVAPTAAKYGKQIRHADRRGIPFVWFPQDDGGHQVRDIRSGDQVPADPGSWAPPAQDLHPRVISG
jgi:histidyl-tRNA synthetase